MHATSGEASVRDSVVVVACLHASSVTMISTRRRRRRRLFDGDAKIVKHARAVTALLLPPAIVLTALQVSCAYTLLFACQVVLALGGLELSWWHFRIRKRLLIPLRYGDENLSRDEYERLQFDEMNPDKCAVSPLADKFLCGRKWVAAMLVSALVGGGVVGVVVACQGMIVDPSKSTLGWRMVLGCAALGTTLSTFCACFAPTARDALIVLVYQACFTLSSLNTFLAQYENWVDDPELLDSLYVILVGVCAVVVWRIVASKEVVETTITIALDIFGLVFLTSPMMETADFVDHPNASKYSDKITTFWLVICTAEVGHYLYVNLRRRLPRAFQRCDESSVAKAIPTSHGLEDLVVSTAFSMTGALISLLVYPDHKFENWEIVILVTAVVLSQMSRLGVVTMKAMAKVTPPASRGDRARWSLWDNGVMVLVSPYLVAAIVFHPYIKSLIKSSSSSSSA
ncbi:hypothetical protein Gpo141_00000805 [Globisporangium polare]